MDHKDCKGVGKALDDSGVGIWDLERGGDGCGVKIKGIQVTEKARFELHAVLGGLKIVKVGTEAIREGICGEKVEGNW